MITVRAAAEDERDDSTIPGVFPQRRRVGHVGRLHYHTDRCGMEPPLGSHVSHVALRNLSTH